MSDDVKKVAQEQAEEAYVLFLSYAKKISWGAIALLLVVLLISNSSIFPLKSSFLIILSDIYFVSIKKN